MDEIRAINQSLMRGGEGFCVFYSFNPPKSQSSWINEEALIKEKGKKVYHSTYRRAEGLAWRTVFYRSPKA